MNADTTGQSRDLVAASGLFEESWYRQTHADALGSADPLDHYLSVGWRQGLSPSPSFDGPAYLEANADVAAAGMNPLEHYLRFGAAEGRPMRAVDDGVLMEAVGLFDRRWYRATYRAELGARDPVEHYLTTGWRLGFSPGPHFDAPAYLKANPEVVANGIEPLTHFIRYGLREGRPLKAKGAPEGSRRLIEGSGLFDPDWYGQTYKEAIGSDDPLDHYILAGWRRGFWPGPRFDGPAYLKANPDILAAGLEPLEHFIRFGASEGRQGILFDAQFPEMELALPAETAALILETSPDRHGAGSVADLRADPLVDLVARHATGRDLLEVGFRGTATLELVAAGLARGASRCRVLVSFRPALMKERLLRVGERLGVGQDVARYLDRFVAGQPDTWQPIWTETVGNDWVILSHFYERDLKNKIGRIDLLLALSSAVHAFEIVHFLQRAAYLTDDLVLFDMPVVEPFERLVEGQPVRFSAGDIWFAGDMSNLQTRAMADHWRDRGIELGQFASRLGGLTRQRVAAEGLSGIWWWFVGAEGLARLLALADLEIVERQPLPAGPTVAVLVRKRIPSGAAAPGAGPGVP